MALTAYQAALMNLIQSPSSPIPLIPTASQTTYINTARNQVAADAECIRSDGSLALTNAVQFYPFSAISVTGSGIGSVIAVRSGALLGVPLDIRGWEWFAQYYLYSGATGTPAHCAQQGQGVAGTLAFSPVPNGSFTPILDVVCLPIALVDDTTPEAIPELWTDAVPFYAAWLAYQSMQRQADAEMMLRRYQMLVRRGRQTATPSELPSSLPGGAGTQMAAAKTTLAGEQPAAGR